MGERRCSADVAHAISGQRTGRGEVRRDRVGAGQRGMCTTRWQQADLARCDIGTLVPSHVTRVRTPTKPLGCVELRRRRRSRDGRAFARGRSRVGRSFADPVNARHVPVLGEEATIVGCGCTRCAPRREVLDDRTKRHRSARCTWPMPWPKWRAVPAASAGRSYAGLGHQAARLVWAGAVNKGTPQALRANSQCGSGRVRIQLFSLEICCTLLTRACRASWYQA